MNSHSSELKEAENKYAMLKSIPSDMPHHQASDSPSELHGHLFQYPDVTPLQ